MVIKNSVKKFIKDPDYDLSYEFHHLLIIRSQSIDNENTLDCGVIK